MIQDRRITDKLPGHPLQWDDSASPSAAPAAGQAGLAKEDPIAPLSEFTNGSIRNYPDFVEDIQRLGTADKKTARHIRKDVYDTIDARVRNAVKAALASVAAPVAADTEQASDSKLVPAKPTKQMLEAARLAWACNPGVDMEAICAAMLAAAPAAPLATPADAGEGLEDLIELIGKALRRAYNLGQTYWQQADSEYRSQNRKADETAAKFESLVNDTRNSLARLSKPGAPVTASDEEDFAAIGAGASAFAAVLQGRRGQSPAPVTAEPAQSIDTPEFRALMAEHWKACGSVKANKAHGAVVMYVNDFIATHSAPADRDAIRDAALDEAAKLCGARLNVGLAQAIMDLKSMERAADAAETRDAKGGEQ